MTFFSSNCFIRTGTCTAGRSTLLALRRPSCISLNFKRNSGGIGANSPKILFFLANSGVRKVPPLRLGGFGSLLDARGSA